jgi:peroxin-5
MMMDSLFLANIYSVRDSFLPILVYLHLRCVAEQDNKYLGPSASTRSSLDEAKMLLEQNGSLSEAALLLEAAIQKGELGEGGYEAWILLGETRNMDEREDAGMRALAEGVRRAETAGSPGLGMLVSKVNNPPHLVTIFTKLQSLAISYTNESYDKASHLMLLRWLRSRHPSHPIPEETLKAVGHNLPWDTHTRVTEAFLSLARQQHKDGILDPDVQVGLGILFYANAEFDLAKDCFQSALSVRPKASQPMQQSSVVFDFLLQDYLLWNRLGSSLSNGSKPEEALGAYQEALQLRPTYTRAIYNVGVACMCGSGDLLNFLTTG